MHNERTAANQTCLPAGVWLSVAMSRNIDRNAAATSRQRTVLHALHLGKFVGEPHASDREDQAISQSKRVNEPTTAMIVVASRANRGSRNPTAPPTGCTLACCRDPAWRGRNRITQPGSEGLADRMLHYFPSLRSTESTVSFVVLPENVPSLSHARSNLPSRRHCRRLVLSKARR